MLFFGGCLLLAARASDVLGRKRIFITGLRLFTLASLVISLLDCPIRMSPNWDFPDQSRVRACALRSGIFISVSTATRRRFEAIVAGRKSAQKHVWRARIVLSVRRRGRHGRDHA